MNRDMNRGLGSFARGYANGGGVPRQTMIGNEPHHLAYINAQEDQMLRDAGGSGIPGPGGIPAFVRIVDEYGVAHNVDRKEAADFQANVDYNKSLLTAASSGNFSGLGQEAAGQAAQIVDRVDMGEDAYATQERRDDRQEERRNKQAKASDVTLPSTTFTNVFDPNAELNAYGGVQDPSTVVSSGSVSVPYAAAPSDPPPLAQLPALEEDEFTDDRDSGIMRIPGMTQILGAGVSALGGTSPDDSAVSVVDEQPIYQKSELEGGGFYATNAVGLPYDVLSSETLQSVKPEDTGFQTHAGFKDLTVVSNRRDDDPVATPDYTPRIPGYIPPPEILPPQITVAPEPTPFQSPTEVLPSETIINQQPPDAYGENIVDILPPENPFQEVEIPGAPVPLPAEVMQPVQQPAEVLQPVQQPAEVLQPVQQPTVTEDYGSLSGQAAGAGQPYNLNPTAFMGDLGNYDMNAGQHSPVTSDMFNQSYVEGATSLPNNVGNFQQASADPINAAGTSNVALPDYYSSGNTGLTFQEMLAMYQTPYSGGVA
jgi:hypothetical protein